VKRIAILAITSASAPLAPVWAGVEERAFISEDLYVFLHRGPSSQFKIVGTLMAGTPITVDQPQRRQRLRRGPRRPGQERLGRGALPER
jgi:uncharacterized protein YgiM (DUF1202 family)